MRRFFGRLPRTPLAPLMLLFLLGSWAWIVQAGPLPQATTLQEQQIQQIRNDLEVMADRVFGGGARPAEWTGNTDLAASGAAADAWFDNELVANAVFGANQRPPEWIGATSNNPQIFLRNVRHDLELSAENFFGDFRPSDWEGGPLLFTCERTLMNTVFLMNQFYNIEPETPESVVNYCEAVAAEIEDRLIDATFNAEAATARPDEAGNLPNLILAIRGDLERLADEILGLNARPPSWIGNRDIASPTLARDIFSDMQRLADAELGIDQRPDGWQGVISPSLPITYRNLRLDLELLADVLLGENVRPTGWQGEDPITRCRPAVQNLVLVVELNFDFNLPAFTEGDDIDAYCAQVEEQANLQAENLPEERQDPDAERFTAQSELAFSYLDVSALDYMGIMPLGTEFRAWYRNFGDSTMMFVSGQDFAVFIDRRWTSMDEEIFRQLPTLEGVAPLTFCDARWCNGPAPTPTSTGGGPIYDLINASTPPPVTGQLPQGANGEDLQEVNWNHIRVNYLLQRPDISAAQVTLEICQDVAQVACEPVLSVFNTATGQTVPVISTVNGLNVYELPYGYSTTYVIQGATLISNDIWINDPGLSGG